MHRLLSLSGLSKAAFVALAALEALKGLPHVDGAALPPLTVRELGCKPSLSGLVQEIRASSEPGVVWKAVNGEGLAQDGVKADTFPKSNRGPLPLEYEWFVEHTTEPGVYSISSSATVSACGELSTSASTNPFSPKPQRAFAPGDAVRAATACSPAHLFRLTCTSCDFHEDSAHGCLVQSVSKGQCIELLPAQEAGERPRLGWSKCLTEQEGEHDQRRQRQLWDIIPT